jgi:signal recognition particle receptor subunit beta
MARAIPDCTAEEIADILWLAAARRAEPLGSRASPQAERAVVQPSGAPTPPPPQGEQGTVRPRRAEQRPTMLMHGGLPVPEARVAAATAVGLRAPASMAGAITTGRMFSPFRRIHRPGPWEVDVDATVEATADARRLTIVTRPARERGLDVALVADTSPVMTACRNAVAELEAILIRAGSFRSVSRWTLSPHAEEVLVLDRAGAEHIPDRLADPSGRRLVLLVTDATADHWYHAGLWRAIRNWAELMPTAILHVLPKQYGTSGPLGGSPITMRSARPAAPNGSADVEVPWWAGASDDIRGGAIPVPVVGLVPSELAAWARAVAVGTGWVDAVWACEPSESSAGEANAELSIEDRVRAFQVRGSRGAQALARVLAGAPVLSLPLISVLQSRLLPETGLSELAEVLVSGLLEESPAPTVHSRDGRFQFRASAGDLLRRGTTADQEWDTFQAISQYLAQNAGTGNSIRALIADPHGPATVDAELEPFAAVGRAVAVRLGIAPRESAPQESEPELPRPADAADEEPRPADDLTTDALNAEPRRQLETIGEETRLVRPYAVTGGRTEPRAELALDALVCSTVYEPGELAVLAPECQAILQFCLDWRSVAEISAVLRLPLGVVRILVADLSADGLLRVHQPPVEEGSDRDLLTRVLEGLRGSGPSGPSEARKAQDAVPVKIVIAGGFGAGKSTFVGSVSEIAPLKTEAVMTSASTDIDDLSGVPDKMTMTAAMDFGRITLAGDLVLYMFGTPGVPRLWFFWDYLIQGAIGAVVLVDTRRLADSFPAVDYFERVGLPFVIGVNGFHGEFPYAVDDVRRALDIEPTVPVVQCDARARESAKATVVTLLEHALSVAKARPGTRPDER